MKITQPTFIMWGTFSGVLIGLLIGGFFVEIALNIKWIGQLFLNALKMTIIPLIFSAIISGVCNLNRTSNFGRTGLITVVYYTFTTSFAVLIGLLCVNFLRPGQSLNLSDKDLGKLSNSTGSISLSDIPL
ncbi:MAG: cation:dicarboxylase symporter family transporter, partial [Pseudomonadota bacterium]|nr:cation:dicarboxylase symporter family transporter [Pseudomonadota bacterium]